MLFRSNAWSRSNRWFHIDVINATATYNQDPGIATTYATKDNKAKRPIIEFYPNLRLFNSGIYGKAPIDFVDTKTTDAFSEVAGHKQYYPDTSSYTKYTATINGVSGSATINIGSTNNFNNIVTLSSGTTSSFSVNDPVVFVSYIIYDTFFDKLKLFNPIILFFTVPRLCLLKCFRDVAKSIGLYPVLGFLRAALKYCQYKEPFPYPLYPIQRPPT